MLCRLDKFLVSQGACTRREAGVLCRRGRVTVDGIVASDSACKIDPDRVEVALDGHPLTFRRHLYLMLHKPQGVVSASRDSRDKTVLDLVPPSLSRRGLFPAGRLDKDTTGLVLLTDDGNWAHRLLAPKSHVPKRYEVRLDSPLAPDTPARFAEGIVLADGTVCAPSKLQQLEEGKQPLWEITITEGRYHQIKRMFGTLDHRVVGLHRVAIGDLSLDPALAAGDCRELTEAEIAAAQAKRPIFL